jgi:hypothetical protein
MVDLAKKNFMELDVIEQVAPYIPDARYDRYNTARNQDH